MRLWLYILCLYLPTITFAQGEEVQINVYSFEDGLSHRNVFRIEQDAKGYIWLATFNGLNRFDGLQFDVFDYQHEDESSSIGFISDMEIDDNGYLYLLDDKGIWQYHFEKNLSKKLISKAQLEHDARPDQLYIDTNNQLWWTSFSNQISRSWLHAPPTHHATKIPLLGNYPQKPIAEDANYIYVVTDQNRIQQIPKSNGEIQFHQLQDKALITDLFVDTQNTLWVVNEKGILFYHTGNQFVKHPVSEKIQTNGHTLNAIYVEPNGDIWLGGFSNLWHYHARTKKLSNYNNRVRQITKNAVNYRSFFRDQQGLMWIASDFGAIKISKSNQLFQNYLNEGSEYCNQGVCSMRGITGDGKNKVFFTYYNSIHQLDVETDEMRPLFRSFPFDNASFGIAYKNEKLYIGNGRRIDLQTMQVDTLFAAPPTDKGVVCWDKDSLLWMAFEQNIYLFDDADQTIQADFLNVIQPAIQSDITYLYQGKYQNYFWIGTQENGLIRFYKTTKKIEVFHSENSNLASNRILAIYEDQATQLWIASADGLHRMDIPSGTITRKSTDDGLTNNFINGLLSEGDSCIWVSTDNGLSRYSIAQNSCTNYYQGDGLSSNEFNRISFYQSPDGRMYFGGLNGVNAFFPSKQFVQEKEKNKAPLLFTSFARFDGHIDSLLTQKRQLNPDSTIILTHQDKFFTIEFALADYKTPSQNKYSYMLEGFEPDWSKPSNNNLARYYNIPPGDYLFKVKAASVGENWNDQILEIPIVVKDAFYNTWWFLITALVAATTMLLGLFRLRIYRIEQGRRKLEEEVTLRTQELQKEKQKSDELLLNILPAETAEELKQFGKTKAKRFDHVTVFFSDFKGFSALAKTMEPEQLVAEIDKCFRTFDEIMEMYGLEKIKTIGDAYMCAGGVPSPSKDAAANVVRAALEIQAYMNALAFEKRDRNEPYFEARIGIHTGSIVAGVVGIKKFAYDIWGDTVNVAARMEENGEVGKVNISEATYQFVKNEFRCTSRGKIEVKNRGAIEMYFVDGKK